MSPAVTRDQVFVGGVSGLGGLLLVLGLLLILSSIHRWEEPSREIEPLDIMSVEVPSPDEESSQVAQSVVSPVTTVTALPSKPKVIPARTVEPMPLSLRVDVTQVLESRNTLDYLVSQRDLFGAFGSVRLQGVDRLPRTLYIPPNVFPKTLKDQGIYFGRVMVLIEISEQGIGRVRRVIDADYPELVDPVVDSIHGAIYSRPTRRGEPARTIIKSLVHFRSGPEGDKLTQEIQEGGN